MVDLDFSEERLNKMINRGEIKENEARLTFLEEKANYEDMLDNYSNQECHCNEVFY